MCRNVKWQKANHSTPDQVSALQSENNRYIEIERERERERE